MNVNSVGEQVKADRAGIHEEHKSLPTDKNKTKSKTEIKT